MTAADWIPRLALIPHPEDRYFRETYRSGERVAPEHLPSRYGGPRVFGTAIYFLLPGDQVSALHRIGSDEIWHFYAGYALAGCTVAPGFDFADFELADRARLLRAHARHRAMIERLTR